jgi:Carboxypeptidase regulatory-like domain
MRFALFLLLSSAWLNAQTSPATLDGDIVNSVTGAPVPSARIKLVIKGQPQYATADAAGHFHFDSVSPGSYTLSVDHPAYLAYTSSSNTAALSTLKVPLVAGAIIYGSVTDPNGLPAMTGGMFFAQIYQRGPTNATSGLATVSHAIMVDDRGQYRSELLPPGTYYVAVIAQRAPSFWVQNWRSTYYPHSLNVENAKPIQLSPGQEVRADVQVIDQPGITAGGHFSVPASDPPPAGMQISTGIYLVPQDRFFGGSGGNASVVNDRYEVRDLLPGKYTLMAETRQTSADGRNAKYLFGALRTVDIGEREVSNLDLELQPLPPITGTVTLANGCATRAIPVHLQGGGIMGIQTFSTVSAADGSFSFAPFHPSPMSISVALDETATIYLGDRDITRGSFDYPTPTPQAVRIVVQCAAGGAR